VIADGRAPPVWRLFGLFPLNIGVVCPLGNESAVRSNDSPLHRIAQRPILAAMDPLPVHIQASIGDDYTRKGVSRVDQHCEC
jgi:hypothetical protein